MKTVQQHSGLTADSQAGPDTWKHLGHPVPDRGHCFVMPGGDDTRIPNPERRAASPAA
ncbi:hypothetical protein [Streptomyces sp. TLI_105]|uniref:hypothetical protein n=1 Tax=Streptomyces sp. TLI_105 TaxID=1881019 RepID=UPI000896ABFB|nr:hypothetical protein [Streptomyces sp. TLI_105]SEE18168.1 hypothetical protein SAMN05428939_7630 [Streptomyces sp. TLI_105]